LLIVLILHIWCIDVFKENETCLSTHTQDAWITALAWSGISTKNVHDFCTQYLLVGGVDGSVNITTIEAFNKITFEKLNDFCCPGCLLLYVQIMNLI